ncbi:FAD-binding dehydrogenase [Corynebacterium ulceribovis]|uniref:FAD-binding dehydrogenase n=1 Tax=Corynebacterium ulceribovis TaxID=487732 RepID=UPI000372C97E|nr:FAD-binding dehydrogenase [Corynebacterium ulceribovis]
MTSVSESIFKPDAIIIGSGLSGLVTAYEAAKAGRRVMILDREDSPNLGGQAFWSLGGLFLVDSPEQRRLGVSDSAELAWQDWLGSADFDPEGDNDAWGKKWAREYINFATYEKRDYLRGLGLRVVPTVGWAERGDGRADGHGNSVPRFHLAWGTGPEIVRIFEEQLREQEKLGRVQWAWRHRVDEIVQEDGKVVGVRGKVLEDCAYMGRGAKSNERELSDFEIRSPNVVIATGGIGGNLDLVRENWPTEKFGPMPDDAVTGVPAYVDGSGLKIAEASGANVVNKSRMWHYTEGMANWDSIWPNHGIRLIPGPSAMWFDATGERLEPPNFPGADTNRSLQRVLSTGHSYSWFIFNQPIAEKEIMFSGSEQNPDLTDKDWRKVASRTGGGIPGPVQKFIDKGEDWIQRENIFDLVKDMNALAGPDAPQLDAAKIAEQIYARDRQITNPFTKDAQVQSIHNARRFLGDKLVRTAKPQRILDPATGPLIAVRLRMLTRKTLGGVQTDLHSRALRADGSVFPGLFAVGEAAGFGGGGVHGNSALEGTFLGGCVFTGMKAGRFLGELPADRPGKMYSNDFPIGPDGAAKQTRKAAEDAEDAANPADPADESPAE